MLHIYDLYSDFWTVGLTASFEFYAVTCNLCETEIRMMLGVWCYLTQL